MERFTEASQPRARKVARLRPRSAAARTALVSVLIACAFAAAGCGGSSGSSSSTSSSGSSSTASGVAYARAQVAQFRKIPGFTLRATPINVSKLRGMTVFNIPLASSDPFQADIDAQMQILARKLGIHFIEWQNQGTPTEWSAGVRQAISEKVNVINLQTGPAPDLMIPAMQAAKAAHIPVTVTHLYADAATIPPAALPYVTATVYAPFFQAMRLAADWIIADSNGKANVLIVTSNDVAISKFNVAATEAEYKARCPSCKATVIDVPVTQWATGVQPAVESALRQDPSIKYVNTLYDPMGIYATAAVRAAGMTGRVKVVSYNGTPSVLRVLQTDKTYAMDIGENTTGLAYADMDTIMRVLLHAPLVPGNNEHTAVRIFDGTNISQVGTPPQPGVGYGNSFVAGYDRLWGVTP